MQGDGEIVLITGEPGIGKSRLLHALHDHLADQPHTPVRLQCSPFHTNSALYPMIDQIERAAGFVPGDDAPAKLEKLEALLAIPGAPSAETAPLFASLLSIPADGRYTPPSIGPQQQKEMTLRCFASVCWRMRRCARCCWSWRMRIGVIRRRSS